MLESENIISKIIDPIYHLMDKNRKQKKLSVEEDESKNKVIKNWNIEEYHKIYSLMKLVFKATSNSFSKFFYLQKDKYLSTFVLFIFKCLEND